MILRTGSPRAANRAASRAFTLIELILVMTLLMIVLAVSAPSLQRFFKGRNLDSEARRVYSLVQYAQSRAVSESIPMLVWFDPDGRAYGLRAATTYLETDPRMVEFNLDRDLQLEVYHPRVERGVFVRPFVDRHVGNLPVIRFMPDGAIADTSPESILIIQPPNDAIEIAINTNRLRYVILPGNPYANRR